MLVVAVVDVVDVRARLRLGGCSASDAAMTSLAEAPVSNVEHTDR